MELKNILKISKLSKGTTLLLVGLLFLPSLLPFYLYDHGAFGRKEVIGFLILLWHLYLLEAPGNRAPTRYVRKIIPMSLIALPVHLLMHEAAFFLFVPVHLLISHAIIRQDGSVGPYRRAFTLLLVYLPVCVSFLAVSLFGSPTFTEALDICIHWELLGEFEPGTCLSDGKIISLSNYTPATSFMTLPWTLSEAAFDVMSFPVSILLSWVLTSLILGFCTLYIGSLVIDALWRGKATRSFDLTALAAPPARVLNLKYFFVPVLVSAPLYIVGSNIGRWVAVTCINYILIILSKEIVFTELEYSRFSRGNTGQKSRVINSSVPTLGFYGNLFIFLFILFYLRLPHCCMGNLTMFAEPLGTILRTAVRVLSQIFG